MKTYYKAEVILMLLGSLLAGCTKPLVIEVKQAPAQLAVVSSVLNRHTLLLTLTHSINSLANLDEDGAGQGSLGLVNGILATDATVLLSTPAHTDTLLALYPGIYGSNKLNLVPYQSYKLTVQENKNSVPVTSLATYISMVPVDTLRPAVDRTKTDTTVTLHLVMQDDPNRTDYYLMSYSNINPASALLALGSSNFGALAASPNKNLELFTDADLDKGRIRRDFPVTIRTSDTLCVHLGRIEKGYFEYLSAYKRTGSLLTALTNEPITLPTNVNLGLGYFSLYEVHQSVFFLKDY